MIDFALKRTNLWDYPTCLSLPHASLVTLLKIKLKKRKNKKQKKKNILLINSLRCLNIFMFVTKWNNFGWTWGGGRKNQGFLIGDCGSIYLEVECKERASF